jgi:hypothetical protein
MKQPSTTKSRKRDQQIEDGAYDGRYKTKIVPDKKKEANRKRIKKIDPYEKFPSTNRQGI